MLDKCFMELRERRVGLDHDPVLPAAFDSVMFNIHWVNFELVHYWPDLSDLKEQIDVFRKKV